MFFFHSFHHKICNSPLVLLLTITEKSHSCVVDLYGLIGSEREDVIVGIETSGSMRTVIGLKFSRHFFNQSEVKPKPIVAHAYTFSPALCRLRVITSSFDWLTGLSQSFLIAQSNYFGFGFTTLS